MRLLIIGGTVFLGRHIVDAALSAGHRVTLFNRGKSRPDAFPRIEQLHGDRDGGLGVLRSRSWDAVIDTCGYVPRIVRQGVDALKDSVGHYTFVSSISVYADTSGHEIDESAAVGTLDDPSIEAITGESYGPLKALCEREVRTALGERAFIVRPGLLVGPHDPTGRFTYWVRRIADGGDILAPGDPQMQVQFIDTRDVAAWMVRCAEGRTSGVHNVTGPADRMSMREFLEASCRILSRDARLTWVSEEFLLAHDVKPWTEIPLWLPSTDPGILSASIAKALATGLSIRPLEQTLRDTLEWQASSDAQRPPPARATSALTSNIGLAREREAELLAGWRARA